MPRQRRANIKAVPANSFARTLPEIGIQTLSELSENSLGLCKEGSVEVRVATACRSAGAVKVIMSSNDLQLAGRMLMKTIFYPLLVLPTR
jgi:hypothetical protein